MKKLLSVFALYVLICFQGMASHILGGAITYQYLTRNQYLISLSLYQDCSGISFPNSVNIEAFSDINRNRSLSRNFNPDNAHNIFTNNVADITCYLRPGTGNNIPSLPRECEANVTTTCNGGTAFGVRVWVYDGIFTVPANIQDSLQHFIFKYTDCCRPPSVVNILNASSEGFCIISYLDHFYSQGNNSPTAPLIQVPSYCILYPFTIRASVVDLDGDSLSFSLYCPKSTDCSVVTYDTANGYSCSNPFASVIPIVFDISGGITIQTNKSQISSFGLRSTDFRNRRRVGYVESDLIAAIEQGRACDILQLEFKTDTLLVDCEQDSITVVFQRKTPTVIKPAGQALISSVDPKGSDFRVADILGTALPIKSVRPLNSRLPAGVSAPNFITDSLRIVFDVPIIGNDRIFYIISKKGNDGNTISNYCGEDMAEFDTITMLTKNNCYKYEKPMDLIKVTVDTNGYTGNFIRWNKPDTLNYKYFRYFNLYRSEAPYDTWSVIKSFTDTTITSYVDANPPKSPDEQPYLYTINVKIWLDQENPYADSLSTIRLYPDKPDIPDSTDLLIKWTSHIGWNVTDYRLEMAPDSGSTEWKEIARLNANSYLIKKPIIPGNYKLRIHAYKPTIFAGDSLITYSNVIKYVSTDKSLTIPNTFTPNGDGINDAFVIKNLRFFPNSSLVVFDRWGKKVFETADYKNDWGANVEPGLYFFELIQNKESTLVTTKGTIKAVK